MLAPIILPPQLWVFEHLVRCLKLLEPPLGQLLSLLILPKEHKLSQGIQARWRSLQRCRQLCLSLCCTSSRVSRDKAAAKLGHSCMSSGAQNLPLVHFHRPYPALGSSQVQTKPPKMGRPTSWRSGCSRSAACRKAVLMEASEVSPWLPESSPSSA